MVTSKTNGLAATLALLIDPSVFDTPGNGPRISMESSSFSVFDLISASRAVRTLLDPHSVRLAVLGGSRIRGGELPGRLLETIVIGSLRA